MRILWVGTKAPWPPRDGGRLVAWHTLRALAEAGHRVTLVAPGAGPTPAAYEGVCEAVLVDAPPLPFALAGLRALLSAQPVTAVRHARPLPGARVADLLARERFDVVHAEQPHALAACAPAFARGVPVVLRAHNVESDLWTAAGRGRGMRAWVARREAPRVAAWEAECVRRCARTVALSEEDGRALASLTGGAGRIRVVPPPFPASLDAGSARLAGEPPVVVMGSAGWLPNQRGSAWFASEAWPRVRDAVPGARLHVFGGGDAPADAARHGPPPDSSAAFAPGSVHAVPLTFASGVRMRILEAWARGVPVVATRAAASGLRGADAMLVADTPEAFAEAVRRIAAEPGVAAALVAAGHARLAEHHDPSAVAAALARVYEEAAGSPA